MVHVQFETNWISKEKENAKVIQQTTTKRTTLSHHDGAYSASASTLATAALSIKPTEGSLTLHSPHEWKAH